MLAHSAFPASSAPAAQPAVVVDLIGDVDVTAVRSFAAFAADVAVPTSQRVVLNLRRVSLLDAGGITMLARTVAELRSRGTMVDVVAESKRVHTALRAARIGSRVAGALDLTALERHVMIVRNANPSRDA